MTRPYLRVVRDSAPPPRLELPRAQVRGPWSDAPWVGVLLVAVMFLGVGLVAVAVGWIHP